MPEVAVKVDPAAIAAAAPKTMKPSKRTASVKKVKARASHPPVSEMVVIAIQTLKDRHGSSLRAIRKYIAVNYLCDVEKLSRFIKQALKTGVEKGTLVQTKGTGASGSFKLKKLEPKTRKKVVQADDKSKKVEKANKKIPKAAIAKTVTKNPKSAAGKVTAVEKKATKKSGSVAKKVAASPKQKPTNPSKTAIAVKKPKTPKSKKASASRK